MHDIPSKPWWRQLSGYHWFVFCVASAAWFFDCLDQRLFSLARIPALVSLMHLPASDIGLQSFGKYVTSFFLIGWGIGGMIFGSLGDKYGRARMLNVSVLIYSVFTGLSFFSVNQYDFTLFRFLTGLGIGGVFGLAVSLIAETVPVGARTQSLGLLQVLSTVGNLTAGVTMRFLTGLETNETVKHGESWRWMFLIGAVPALLVILTGRYLREPAAWLALKEKDLLPKHGLLGPYIDLLTNLRWRRNLIVGALIASTGVVGLWAIAEFAVDLQTAVFTGYYQQHVVAAEVKAHMDSLKGAGLTEKAAQGVVIKAHVDNAKYYAYMLMMAGAAVGMWMFTKLAQAAGRRVAFLVGFSAAMIVTFLAYWKMESPQDAYWMMPIMGAAQLSVFAGFSIYLPELFPSRLRSTGTSFCYNIGRFAAAAGGLSSALLTQGAFGKFPSPLPFRYSSMTMCIIFLVGILALPFAPETKGQPLPEE